MMGMTIAFGKIITYKGGKKDSIGLDTEVKYSDQNGVGCYLDMRKLIEQGKLCKKSEDEEFFSQLETDIGADNLLIGFPIADAMNRIAVELGDKAVDKIIYFEAKQ